jgi:hypothetical protein
MNDTTNLIDLASRRPRPPVPVIDPFAAGGAAGDGADVGTREIAALEFEPMENAVLLADLTEPNWSTMIADIAVYLRLGALTIGKTKPELVDIARAMLGAADEGNDLFDMLCGFTRVDKHLHSLADVLKDAFCRMNVAAAAVAVEREGGP